jgi:hypothetical protein
MISITLSKRRRDCILGSKDSHRSGHLVGAVNFYGDGREELGRGQARKLRYRGSSRNKGFRSAPASHERVLI